MKIKYMNLCLSILLLILLAFALKYPEVLKESAISFSQDKVFLFQVFLFPMIRLLCGYLLTCLFLIKGKCQVSPIAKKIAGLILAAVLAFYIFSIFYFKTFGISNRLHYGIFQETLTLFYIIGVFAAFIVKEKTKKGQKIIK